MSLLLAHVRVDNGVLASTPRPTLAAAGAPNVSGTFAATTSVPGMVGVGDSGYSGAVAFDAAADALQLTGGTNPSTNTTYTVLMWVRRKSGNQAPAFLFENDATGTDLGLGLNAQVPGIVNGIGFTWPVTIGTALTADVWYCLAMRANGTTGTVSRGDESTAMSHASGTIPSQGAAFRLWFGGTSSTFFPTADISGIRAWNAVLSDAEIEAERTSTTPARTANLFGDWRMSSTGTKLVDSSGLGNNLTAPGVGPWQTTGPAPNTATGTSGTLAATTPLATLAAAGTSTVTATAAPTTPLATLVASGTSTVAGTESATTPLATLAASGAPIVSSAFAATTVLPGLVAAGSPVVSSTASVAAPIPTLAAVGSAGSNAFSATTPLATLVASGAPTVSGSLSSTTTFATLVASGTLTVTGTETSTTPLATLVASGTVVASGSLASTTPLSTLVSAGTPVVSGSTAVSTSLATLVATGATGASAFSAITPLATLVASGTSTVTSALAASTPLATLAAIGAVTDSATFAATTPLSSLVGVGTSTVTGAAAVVTPIATLVAVGSLGSNTITGTLSATTPLPVLVASSLQPSMAFAYVGQAVSVVLVTGFATVTAQGGASVQPTSSPAAVALPSSKATVVLQ
jgi:hypothetical protein